MGDVAVRVVATLERGRAEDIFGEARVDGAFGRSLEPRPSSARREQRHGETGGDQPGPASSTARPGGRLAMQHDPEAAEVVPYVEDVCHVASVPSLCTTEPRRQG